MQARWKENFIDPVNLAFLIYWSGCYEMKPRPNMKTSRCDRTHPIGMLCGWLRPIPGTHQEGNPRPPCVLP